ncbi:hypothetical protein OIO90_005490 [Microbotryomycetes sp. JL221]|nr:hypothetical protein OIO90_005490 [Microbotryomycetes sp. JL221]
MHAAEVSTRVPREAWRGQPIKLRPASDDDLRQSVISLTTGPDRVAEDDLEDLFRVSYGDIDTSKQAKPCMAAVPSQVKPSTSPQQQHSRVPRLAPNGQARRQPDLSTPTSTISDCSSNPRLINQASKARAPDGPARPAAPAGRTSTTTRRHGHSVDSFDAQGSAEHVPAGHDSRSKDSSVRQNSRITASQTHTNTSALSTPGICENEDKGLENSYPARRSKSTRVAKSSKSSPRPPPKIRRKSFTAPKQYHHYDVDDVNIVPPWMATPGPQLFRDANGELSTTGRMEDLVLPGEPPYLSPLQIVA